MLAGPHRRTEAQATGSSARFASTPPAAPLLTEHRRAPPLAPLSPQGFNWESWKHNWFNTITDKAPQIAEMGFSAIWLPPFTGGWQGRARHCVLLAPLSYLSYRSGGRSGQPPPVLCHAALHGFV